MAKLSEITAQYRRLQAQHSARDSARLAVLNVREGRIASVFPDLFPPDGPLADKSLAANMVDIAARDVSEVLSPLPTINCSSGTGKSDTAREFAELRTLIANNYVEHSRLQKQMYTSTDRYASYGTAIGIVEADWDQEMPFIRLLDPLGCYIVRDRFFRIQALFQTMVSYVDDLIAQYPEMKQQITSRGQVGQQIEIVRYHDKDEDILFMPQSGGWILNRMANPVGKVLVREAARPGISDEPRGQFDDVLAIQVAKHRFALLAMKASITAVDAPIAVPQDVQELAIGSEAILRSASPERIRRIGLDVPREAFIEQQQLDQELRLGSRYPEARTGAVDGSVVTGKGVQALMGGFDTQIRTGQSMYALMLQELVELAFEVDETIWGEQTKTIRGHHNGAPFKVNYKPSRDIRGDYTVNVVYGLLAGLDPNRALVFGLQARGDKLISRTFLRTQMPFSLNPSDEEANIDIEDLRDALKNAVAGYASAIPALATQGQDPGEILKRLSDVIIGRQKGTPIEELISKAFAPEAPPPGVESPDAAASPDSGMPGETPPGEPGGVPQGLNSDGTMRGVAPGQQAMGPGGRPDVQNLLAGLTSRGDAALSANVQRRQPI